MLNALYLVSIYHITVSVPTQLKLFFNKSPSCDPYRDLSTKSYGLEVMCMKKSKVEGNNNNKQINRFDKQKQPLHPSTICCLHLLLKRCLNLPLPLLVMSQDPCEQAPEWGWGNGVSQHALTLALQLNCSQQQRESFNYPIIYRILSCIHQFCFTL